MFRKLAVIALLSLAVTGWAAADDRHRGASVKIMTQNMDDGTDQTYIIGALAGGDFSAVPAAVDLTYEELQASDFEGRAMLLATEIAERKPELVALQEAVLWRFGPSPDKAKHVLYDNLDLLVSALKKTKVHYEIVTINVLSDVTLPGNQTVGALRFTDRNALLVRSDLKRPNFYLSNVQSRTFDADFPFEISPELTLRITAGWISADVHMGNKQFRLVTTHLESPIPGPFKEASIAVQVAQAGELITALSGATIPVVICGDFNSDANGLGPVDLTPTAGLIQAAGYPDVWPTANGGDPGLTWPYYFEDQFPAPPFFAASEPFERIDLFFSKDMEVVSSDLVLAPAPRGSMPPFGSDHAGVIATFKP